MGMRFLNNPRTFCQYLVVLVVSCSLLLRVLSVGYVIGGLTIKFRDPLLSNNSLLQFINDMFLGILRIGSLLNALILLPIAAVVVNICNAAITYFGICKRKPHCLKISAVISLLLVVFYTLMVAMWSWILGELYDGVKGSFVSVYQQDPTLWNQRWIQMKCCDVEKSTFGSVSCTLAADGDGCFDVFVNTITTYGSSYIAVLVVNILAEIVMIVGIEYLHRLQLMLDVTRTKPGRPIETKELHNIRNGIVLATCASLKATVKKNTSASLFGVMSLFSLGLDGSVVLAIVFLKYNLYDISLTEEFYQITGAHNINLGYTGGALWITAICSFICSMIAKIMCFVGIFSERKWLFVMHIITEVITLLVECIMLVFAALIIKATICCFWKDNAQCAEYTYPTTTVDPFSVCDYWTNSGSIFFSAFALVLILHIILKIILIVLSNEVFLKSKLGQLTEESNQHRSKSVGIFTQASLAAKRFPMVATAILISTIICIVDCLYFCGLLIVRYGSSSYPFIEVADVLSAIRLGPRTMTENRDNAIFIGLTSLSVSFFLQLGKLAAYYIKSSRVILLILWLEILVIILQLVSVSLVTTALKLVYCCFNSQDCVFSYENGLTVYSPISYSYPYSVETMLCNNEQKVWERVMLQSWLMFGFGMLCIFLQILSMIFGYKYFKKSTHGELGIFKGLLDIFRSLLHKISDNRYINEKKMPNYSKAYGLYCILSAVCLVLEVSFAVSLYAYYFTEGNATFLLNALDLISYYQNNFNPIYQGVTISSLVIVPLAAILRIASFVWFWLRRSEVPLYTILIFIPIWSLGEIVLLCYASSVLRLAYGCMDFDLFTFDSLIASQSTICAGLGKRLYIQSGVIVAYLVMHIIFDVAIFVTLGMMQPFVMKNKYKQYVWGVFQNAIKDFRKNQTTTQRFFLATQMIPLVLNFIFWIGLILMGLIPGYIHTGFLDHLTSYLLSVSSVDIKTAVLGILYSLIAVVPIYCTIQVLGAFGLFKRNGTILKVLIISTALLCIADIIYLVFTSDIVHFRRCFCEEEFTCLSYNTTSTEDVHQNVCGNLFLDASSVLITYIIITLIVHILALVLGIKILRGLRVGKVGIVNESENRHTKTDKKSSPANRGKGIETKLNGKKQEHIEETVSRNELQSLALNTEIEENKQEVNVVEELTLKPENTVVNRDTKTSEQTGFGENERRSEKENVSVPNTEKDVTSNVQEDGTSGNELTLPMTEEGLSTQRDDDSEELMLDQELQYYNEQSTKAESETDSVFSQTSEYGQTAQNTDEKLIKQRHDDTEAAIVTTTGAGMQEEM